MKKKLDAKDLGKYGLLFYNSLFMIAPAAFFTWCNGEIQKVKVLIILIDLLKGINWNYMI